MIMMIRREKVSLHSSPSSKFCVFYDEHFLGWRKLWENHEKFSSKWHFVRDFHFSLLRVVNANVNRDGIGFDPGSEAC